MYRLPRWSLSITKLPGLYGHGTRVPLSEEELLMVYALSKELEVNPNSYSLLRCKCKWPGLNCSTTTVLDIDEAGNFSVSVKEGDGDNYRTSYTTLTELALYPNTTVMANNLFDQLYTYNIRGTEFAPVSPFIGNTPDKLLKVSDPLTFLWRHGLIAAQSKFWETIRPIHLCMYTIGGLGLPDTLFFTNAKMDIDKHSIATCDGDQSHFRGVLHAYKDDHNVIAITLPNLSYVGGNTYSQACLGHVLRDVARCFLKITKRLAPSPQAIILFLTYVLQSMVGATYCSFAPVFNSQQKRLYGARLYQLLVKIILSKLNVTFGPNAKKIIEAEYPTFEEVATPLATFKQGLLELLERN